MSVQEERRNKSHLQGISAIFFFDEASKRGDTFRRTLIDLLYAINLQLGAGSFAAYVKCVFRKTLAVNSGITPGRAGTQARWPSDSSMPGVTIM